MIPNIIGFCRICNQCHQVPICGSLLKGENFKITVYNSICNTCVEKVDCIFKHKIQNFKHRACEEKSLETHFSHEEKIKGSPSSNEICIEESPREKSFQDGRKSHRSLFCEFCRKKFTHTGDLNKHRRKHTGERPYDCSLCNRKFSYASNLTRHQRVHSGEKPFSCPLKCGKTFSRKDKLSNHVSKYHPIL